MTDTESPDDGTMRGMGTPAETGAAWANHGVPIHWQGDPSAAEWYEIKNRFVPERGRRMTVTPCSLPSALPSSST